MGKQLARGFLVCLLAFLVGCDHVTKIAAKDELSAGRVVTLVKGVLDLRFTQNFDTAFSLTHGWTSANKVVWLGGVQIAVTLGICALAYSRRRRASRAEMLAFTLIVAGALGNALDRVLRGYVVDFIHLSHWPVFNVADVLVVAGAVLMALGQRGTAPLVSSAVD